MTHRRLWLALLAAVLLSIARTPAQTSSGPYQRAAGDSGEGRVIAIGDIHGSLDGLLAILKSSRLVGDRGQWTGGTATLVQTGDYMDRGPNVREVLDLLMRLEREADRAGGRVHVLFGNHEAMNLLHEFQDVSPQTYAAFADARSEDRRRRGYKEYVQVMKKRRASATPEQEWMSAHPPGFIEYTEALAPGGRYGRWLRSRKVALEHEGTIFMHAGLPPDLEGSLNDVNRNVERELDAWDRGKQALIRAGRIRSFFTRRETQEAAIVELDRIAALVKERRPAEDYVTQTYVQWLQAVASIGKSSLVDVNGPLWFRGMAQWPDEEEPKVTEILKRFGAPRIVIGHTPVLPGAIKARFGNRVFLIDTGMLATYYKGGRPSALELTGPRASAIYTTGTEVLVQSAASVSAPTAPAGIDRN